MDSLDFLDHIGKAELLPVYVVHGEEEFLKRQVIAALRARAVGDGDPAFAVSTHAGEKAEWSAVLGELRTLPFLSPRRLVLVEDAEPFVSNYRTRLEKYLTEPARTGTLVLEVKSWPSNTRLYKLIDQKAAVSCKSPSGPKLSEWCRRWASSEHDKQLPGPAAQLLVDLVGPDMGLLAQEIAKLAVYAGEAKKIELEDVDRLVGNSRAENTFKLFDLLGQGQAGEAMALLDKQLGQGEDPHRILGAFSWQLRKLAQAGRLAVPGRPMATALAEAGFPPFKIREGEQLLRHIGRERVARLFDWLLEVDLGMKGSSQLSERTLLERLVARLARPAPVPKQR